MIAKRIVYMLMLPGLVYAAADSMNKIEALSPKPMAAVNGMVKIRVPQASSTIAIPSVESVSLETFYTNIDAGGITLLHQNEVIKGLADEWYSIIRSDASIQKLMRERESAVSALEKLGLLTEYGTAYVRCLESLLAKTLGLKLFDRIVASIERRERGPELTPEQVKLFHVFQLCGAYCAQDQYALDDEAFDVYTDQIKLASEVNQQRDRRLERLHTLVSTAFSTEAA